MSEVPPDPVNTDQASLVKELKDDAINLKAKFLEVTPVSENTDSNSSNSLQLYRPRKRSYIKSTATKPNCYHFPT